MAYKHSKTDTLYVSFMMLLNQSNPDAIDDIITRLPTEGCTHIKTLTKELTTLLKLRKVLSRERFADVLIPYMERANDWTIDMILTTFAQTFDLEDAMERSQALVDDGSISEEMYLWRCDLFKVLHEHKDVRKLLPCFHSH